MCVVYKSSVYDVALEGIAIETERRQGDDGFARLQTTCHTPCGDLKKVEGLCPGTEWHEKVPFRGPADYDALIALVESRRFVPRYDRFLKHVAHYGASGVARPATEATPMRELICELMRLQTFARDLFDRRDHVLALHRSLLEARRRVLPILRASPVPFFVVEADVSFQLVGERLNRLRALVKEDDPEVVGGRGWSGVPM